MPGITEITEESMIAAHKAAMAYWQALVERKRLEDEEHDRKTRAEKEAAIAVALALYKLIGKEPPPIKKHDPRLGFRTSNGGVEDHSALFRVNFSEISIKNEGIEVLLPILQKILSK